MSDRELEAALDDPAGIHVLGLDAASRSGGALFRVRTAAPGEPPRGLSATRGGVLRDIRLDTVRTCAVGDEWPFAVGILAEMPDARALLVAWEDQYLGANPRSMAVVVAARARLLFALELRAKQRGLRLHAVAVNTMSWQSKVLGKARGKARVTIKATSDERAPQIAALCGSALRPQGDAADATCIGLHEIARHFTIDLAAIRGESGEQAPRRRRR